MGKIWTRLDGHWKAREPFGRSTPPDSSSHAAWIVDDELRMCLLADEMTLEQTKDGYILERDGTSVTVGASFATNLVEEQIQIVLTSPDRALMTLSALSGVARTVGATRLRLCASDSGLQLDFNAEEQWATSTVIDGTLPKSLRLGSSEHSFELAVQWIWSPRCLGYFALGGADSTQVVPLTGERRDSPIVLALDLLAPAATEIWLGKQLLTLERFEPTVDGAADSYYFRLRNAACRHLTVREAADDISKMRELVLKSTAFGIQARVLVDTPPRLGDRYRAELDPNESRIVPSLSSPAPASVWDYGPDRWLFPSIAVPDARVVRGIDADGLLRGSNNKDLNAGRIPPGTRGPAHYIAFQPKHTGPGQGPRRYGFLALTDTVPKGQWRTAANIQGGSGAQLVCWRGLIDRVSVSDIQLCGRTHAVLLFEQGLDLNDRTWFAAPALGVAMFAGAGWWADLRTPTTAVLSWSSKEFSTQGRWIELPAKGSDAVLRPAEFGVNGRVCLFGERMPVELARFSGPVLELDEKGTVRFKGWLSDDEHFVHLPEGQVGIGGQWKSRYALDDADCPEFVKRVLRDAEANPNRSHGQDGNVEWVRRKGMVSAQIVSDGSTGVFVFEPA
jgi:hypothetical protein